MMTLVALTLLGSVSRCFRCLAASRSLLLPRNQRASARLTPPSRASRRLNARSLALALSLFLFPLLPLPPRSILLLAIASTLQSWRGQTLRSLSSSIQRWPSSTLHLAPRVPRPHPATPHPTRRATEMRAT